MDDDMDISIGTEADCEPEIKKKIWMLLSVLAEHGVESIEWRDDHFIGKIQSIQSFKRNLETLENDR